MPSATPPLPSKPYPKDVEFKYNNTKYKLRGYKFLSADRKIYEMEYNTGKIRVTHNFCEIDNLEFIRNLNLSGVYIDVGSFIGNHSVYFANECNSKYVFAFDFYKYNNYLTILNCSVNLKDPHKVITSLFAIGEKKSAGGLLVPNHKNMGLVQTFPLSTPIGYARIVSIDEYFNKPIDNINLIKIDIPKMAFNCLKRAIKTIKKHSPHIMIDFSYEDDKKECLDFLMNLGYKKIYSGSSHVEVFAR